MSYKEWKDGGGFLYKEWGNESYRFHRDSGPAYICYYPDGSIHWEAFYVAGKFLGREKEGFWALWEILTEVERQAPSILKYLARYS